jgi:cytochrome c-type biogenesis protein CcmH
MMKPVLVLNLLLLWLASAACMAAIDEHEFSSVEAERRYNQFINEIRCPQCQNASIAGSDAPIAADLREEVYDQMQEGRTDEQIMGFLKERYGDFISYRPPLNATTFLLWFGPLILLLLGFLVVRRMLAGMQQGDNAATLTTEEASKLDRVISGQEGSQS